MNKEKIQDRIKTLETEREQLRQTLVAYEGAIQDCQHWLRELEKQEINEDSDTSPSS